MRGDGSLYLRGRIWWCEYAGAPESLKTTDKEEAKKRLQKLRKAKEAGTYQKPRERRTLVNELLDDLQTDIDARNVDRDGNVRYMMKRLRDEFGHMRAADLDASTIQKVQTRWRDENGEKPATINKRIERLAQAYRLALLAPPPKRKVQYMPHMITLREDNARQGFVSRADFEAILANLTDPNVQDFIEWFWWTAMRPREIRSLTWEMFDREAWVITLAADAAKTGESRAFALVGPARKVIERRLKARRLDCPLIFHRVSKGKPGTHIDDFRRQWRNALAAAKVAPGLIPYDLRRSAIRNMVRAGVDRTVAMAISGHRSFKTFQRYNITDMQDIEKAMLRTAEYVDTLPTEQKVVGIKGKAKGKAQARG